MNKRTALYGLGMLGGVLVVLFSISGIVRALRPQPAQVALPAGYALHQVATAPASAAAVAATPGAAQVPAVAPLAAGSGPIGSVDVPILMYHHLKELAPDADEEYRQLAVAPQDFLAQINYLQSNGYSTITFSELADGLEGKVALPVKPVIITFDDGWADIYNVAYPLLRERGMRATFFISANWIENLDGVVSWDQVAEMAQGGMEIGSHSWTHPYLTTAEPDDLTTELEYSKKLLEDNTGKTITALAYPFGLYDDNVIAAVINAGYRTACTIDPGLTVTANDLLTLPRLWVYGWTTLDDFAAQLTAKM